MPYIPHTAEDTRMMLETIGVKTIDDLFVEVPDDLKLKAPLNVPSGLDEAALMRHMLALSLKNTDLSQTVCFLGAGIYDRFIPATVGAVLARGEYLTAYTPYQPEASQGYLQTIYEFQSMIAEIYNMDLSNASMYDGPTSMAEAAIMCSHLTGRQRVVISDSVHPHYKEVLQTYCWALGLEVVVLGSQGGLTTDYSTLCDADACVILQYPNFFGQIEDLAAARSHSAKVGAKFIVVGDPIACAMLKPPGDYDVDIVVGEGQQLGIAMGLGGPLLGLFACKREYVRSIPGRIVGRTHDAQGRSGFTMTLRTREQDIRREKATSNICTNEALMALAATVYMTALGKNGMRSVAESTVKNTQYAIVQLCAAGAKLKYGGKVFGEFVLDLGQDAKEVQSKLLEQKILAGLPLGPYWPDLKNCLLVAVTELRTKAQIDDYAAKLAEVLK